MLDGRPSLRTVAGDLEQARVERELLREAARNGLLTVWPRLTFGAVALQWLARFERRVAAGERRERTLEKYRYYLDHHLLPELGRKRIRSLTPADMASLVAALTAKGLAPKTVANALVPLGGILRFARRRGYILDDPLRRLEKAERPRPTPRAQRVLGQSEIADLLRACLPRYRPLLATALYTGMRLSELLALTWADVDFEARLVRVRAQLSRAHLGAPARRVPPKTRAAVRDIPLAPQLATILARERRRTRFAADDDYVFTTRHGTPLGQRNVARTALPTRSSAAASTDAAGRRFASTTSATPSPATSSSTCASTSAKSAASSAMHARRSPSTSTPISSIGRATPPTSAPPWPTAASPTSSRKPPRPHRRSRKTPEGAGGSVEPGERNTRPPARASVARRANVEVLDHSLTNLPCPGTAARPPPESR
jgi:integrase